MEIKKGFIDDMYKTFLYIEIDPKTKYNLLQRYNQILLKNYIDLYIFIYDKYCNNF